MGILSYIYELWGMTENMKKAIGKKYFVLHFVKNEQGSQMYWVENAKIQFSEYKIRIFSGDELYYKESVENIYLHPSEGKVVIKSRDNRDVFIISRCRKTVEQADRQLYISR